MATYHQDVTDRGVAWNLKTSLGISSSSVQTWFNTSPLSLVPPDSLVTEHTMHAALYDDKAVTTSTQAMARGGGGALEYESDVQVPT